MAPVDRELEREIHVVLRALPLPRAPRSLAPRVMQAIRLTMPEALGWRRWPLPWQLAGLLAATSAAAALVLAVPLGTNWIGGLTITRAAIVLWHTFVTPVATPIVIVTAVMFVASALLGGALKHVAWEGQEIPNS